MELEGIRLEEDGRILTVILDRPPVNAISLDMFESILRVFGDLEKRADISVVLLTSGNPRVFCAGVDIREFERSASDNSPDVDQRRQRLARQAFKLILDVGQPTIAVINGPALGAGAVIASCCDLRVGSTEARIGLPEINVARSGGGRYLMRLLPYGVVRRMVFTGEPIDAEALQRYGMLNEVHEPGRELQAAREIAWSIAEKSPYALRVAKGALRATEDLPLDEGYRVEQEHTLKLARTRDAKEAAAAFLEKRKPLRSKEPD